LKRSRVTRQLHILILFILLATSTIACQNNGSIEDEGASISMSEDISDTESNTCSDNSIVANDIYVETLAQDEEIIEIEDNLDKDKGSISDSSIHLEDNKVAESGSIAEVEPIIYRDNSPKVMNPSCPGITVIGNELVTIDISNAGEGYIGVHYTGSNGKVKFQITGPDGVTYTYDLDGGVDIIPLTAGNGGYNLGCYENISGTEYAIAYTGQTDIIVNNEFGPYLYPNMYVNFNAASATVAKGCELAANCINELEVVDAVYQYITDNITYDHTFAETVTSGYIPNVDNVLASGKGICFDYSAVLATMLRSQGIPTRLEVGYAGMAYHAWISVYITDIGWIDGTIQFDGRNWTLMDPTFAANSDREAFEQFIGNSNNYVTLYKY